MSFVEVGGALNAQRPVDGGTATWADYDNDGDQDILGNGASNEAWVLHQNQLIETSGTPGFSDATAAVSLPSLSRVRDVIFFDMDRDADLDLLVLRAGTSPIKLYENTNTGDNSIQVSLEGVDSNRDGLGARLLISAGGVTQVRDSNRNTSLGRQEARRIHFGVGSATNVESLELSWPSGCVQALNDLAVNQVYDIVETCDDEGPIVSDVVADPTPPVEIGTAVELTANVDDSSTGGSPIASADYAIDGGTAVSMTASDGTFDAPAEGVTTIIPGLQTGVYEICVNGTDSASNIGADECILLPVFDPDGGFVTGGGWVDSPSSADREKGASGKATFGFVSKYPPGQSTPDGNLEFRFKAGDIRFHSTSMDWLVVTGEPRAMFRAMVCSTARVPASLRWTPGTSRSPGRTASV